MYLITLLLTIKEKARDFGDIWDNKKIFHRHYTLNVSSKIQVLDTIPN